jgi:hypothetical protein
MNKFTKIRNKLTKGLLVASIAVSVPVMAANDIGALGTNLGAQFGLLTKAAILGSTLLGIIALIGGAMQLKKHGDNPQQVPLAKPLIFIIAGAFMVGLSVTSNTMQKTLFKDEPAISTAFSG